MENDYVKDRITDMIRYRACIIDKPEYTKAIKDYIALNYPEMTYDTGIDVDGFECLRVS